MTTLTAPTLTPGKRDQLTRTRDWLTKLREDLLALAKESESLQAELQKATKESSKLAAKAPFDPKISMKLAAYQSQSKLLMPLVTQAEQALQKAIDTVGKQIGAVRKDDIREVLYPAISEQLRQIAEELISPVVAKEARRQFAVAIIQMFGFRPSRVFFYLNRVAVRPSTAAAAAAWLAITIAEIDGILEGGEIARFDAENGVDTYADQRAAEALGIDLEELILDSQGA